MTKAQIAKMVKAIDARMKGIASERDKLDDAIGTFDELREHCREAWDDLQRARDALSQLV